MHVHYMGHAGMFIAWSMFNDEQHKKCKSAMYNYTSNLMPDTMTSQTCTMIDQSFCDYVIHFAQKRTNAISCGV